jgi:CheY-like chemotaxis protein/anti-sigma regulatory factor (Ser/Thr protein kinase)
VDRHLVGALLIKHGDFQVAYAANGKEALALVKDRAPGLILTDLHMPEMDGLELTVEVRKSFPLVPVILITAFGSEEIAIKALQKGAASYVPKKNLAQDLASTVENVLTIAQANANQQRLLECLAQTESRFLLDNDPTLIPPLIGYLQDNITRMGLCDEIGRIRVSIALQEALLNALQHGNLEVTSELRQKDEKQFQVLLEQRRRKNPFRTRRIHVTARESPSEAVYIVRDEGPGFDPSRLPDPTDPAHLDMVSGRGLLLIRTFMDKVFHNPAGNEITMIKRRDR